MIKNTLNRDEFRQITTVTQLSAKLGEFSTRVYNIIDELISLTNTISVGKGTGRQKLALGGTQTTVDDFGGAVQEGTADHRKLQHLDYTQSGHTGFLPSSHDRNPAIVNGRHVPWVGNSGDVLTLGLYNTYSFQPLSVATHSIPSGGTTGKVLAKTTDNDYDADWVDNIHQILTTKGDILARSTAPIRLPVGSNGKVLTADSGEASGLKWATVSGASYPGAGIAVSTGSDWGTSVTDNSTNWNTAFSFTTSHLSAFVHADIAHSNRTALDAVTGVNTGDQNISGLSPLTTKGDLFTFSTVNTRLAVGTVNGYILSVDSSTPTGLKWVQPNAASMVYPAAGIAVSSGSAWLSSIIDNSSNWNTAYGWGNHASVGYLTTQISHADVVVDGDFTSQGIMLRGTNSGVYSILTDNSANWNTAYGWGNHSGLYTPVAHLTDFVHSDIAHSNRTALNNVSGVNTGDSGTVTNFSCIASSGITSTVSNPTTTPALSLSLGNITPTNVSITSGEFYLVGSSVALGLELNRANVRVGTKFGDLTHGARNISVGVYSLYALNAGNDNLAVGYGSGYALTDGVGNMFYGSGSGETITTGSYNVGLGYSSLKNAATSVSNSVALGCYSGKYETGSNKLFIDSLDRLTESAGRTQSLIYGVFNAAVNSQLVQINGVFFPLQSTTAAAPSYVLGGMYFDTTLNKLRIGGATGWETVTSA